MTVFPALLGLVVAVSASSEQQRQVSPQQERSEQIQLNNAQKAEAEAKAEYYRQMTNKLLQPEPSPSPRTFWNSVVENPGSVSAVVAALLIAMVTLLTLYVNNRNSNRTQRDTQFYEALKRYGDKDSATIRTSAAGLLGQMGQDESRRLRFKREFPFIGWNKIYRYLDTALDQLVSGLLLENNSVVIASTKNAIGLLVPLTPNKAVLTLNEVNLRLQEELADSVAAYFVSKGLSTIPPTSLQDRQYFALWEQIGSLTSIHHSTIRDLSHEVKGCRSS